MEQTYRRQILDHLGLVAGMFEELGIGDVIDKATQQNPEMQIVTAGNAVKAMVLNGRGFVNQRLYLVPRRLRQGAQPEQVMYHLEGALASRPADHQARVNQHSCFILATNELDDAQLSPHALLEGYKGQRYAERGFRIVKDPKLLASSFYLKKPERIMALLMVMTVCLLVYAAVEYRIRKALKEQDATFPNQKGQPVQNRTARWVFHYFVGMHVLPIPGQWYPVVLNLTEEPLHLLQLLGKPYKRFYR